MNRKRIYNLLITLFLFSSCQKDLDVFVPDDPITGPDTTWHNVISTFMPVVELKNNLLLNINRDSFIAGTTPIDITSPQGLQCHLPVGCLATPNGMPVFGEVYFESILLKKKGDFIRMGTPTISNGKMLESGGAFFIRLRNDSSELQLMQGSNIYINYSDPAPSTSMSLFAGQESPPFNWLPLNDSSNMVIPGTQSYQIITNRLRWINCDQFDTLNARTIVSAQLPSNYTNANTIAYTVFNDSRSVIGMYGNANTRKFSSTKVPGGRIVTVIIISKQGHDYFLGHAEVTTLGPSGTIGVNQEVPVMPVITSLENIKAYLNGL